MEELWQIFLRTEQHLTNVPKQSAPDFMSSSKTAELAEVQELNEDNCHEVVSNAFLVVAISLIN